MNTFHFVYLTDNNYILPTVVSMVSLIRNKAVNKKYVIHVLCDSVNEERIEWLRSLCDNNAAVNIIAVDSSNYQGVEKEYGSVSRASLLKFSIAEYLLGDVETALYLDGDTVVLRDLSHIFETDIIEKYAAVIKDGPKKIIAGGKEHAYYGEPTYFNSGVMLLNLSEIRKNGVKDKLIDYRMNQYNYFMDQDAFNRVFDGNVAFLGVENDFMLHLISYQNEEFSLQQLIEFYDLNEYKTVDELFNNVSILHYTVEKRLADAPLPGE